jgi:hypothetical protein
MSDANVNLTIRRWAPIILSGDLQRHAARSDQIAPVTTSNDDVSRAAVLAATACERIPFMCTRDR